MPEFNILRFNEGLMGRLIVAKMTGTDRVEDETPNTVLLQSTVMPDKKFNSCAEWLASIKEDNKLLEDARRREKENKLTMQANLQYHRDWLQAKFKTDEYI
jgi:hypothetical protein